MCGIGGVLNLDGRPVAPTDLERMEASLVHRGPDDGAIWADGTVGLVNRRLAIIDPSVAGRQPMTNATASLVLTYNGEIFNFRELRADLTARGYEFRSRTDTEVVLNAFDRWGEDCVLRFNGQFAFAIWDTMRRRLFLARDRLGIKPLYYLLDGHRLMFASEIRAILADRSVTRRLWYPALDEYFTFQNTLGDHTLFQGIRLLPPGTWLSVTAIDRRITTRQYWDARPRPADRTLDLTEAAVRVRSSLDAAVERQLVADVPVGGYLSGGIDSASVAAAARKALGSLRTFTLGFDLSDVQGRERDFDERAVARETARSLDTEHFEAVMSHSDMERSTADLVWHLEELRVGQSYPNYAVAGFARTFVKVVLSGTGGDELFAGYPWRYGPALAARSRDEFLRGAYRRWQRLVPDDEKSAFFRRDSPLETGGSTFAAFCSVLEGAGMPLRTTADFVDASLYFDLKTFLHGLLVVEDKVSMAHGLEVRVPLLDNDLVDLALGLPYQLKLRGTTSTSNDDGRPTGDGKLVLREAVRPVLGDEAADRPKQGFSAPDATWFRSASRDFVGDVLLDPDSRVYEVIRPGYVREALEEHWAGRRDRRLFIWSLIAFDEWLRRFDVLT